MSEIRGFAQLIPASKYPGTIQKTVVGAPPETKRAVK